jgi:hypothetical protein
LNLAWWRKLADFLGDALTGEKSFEPDNNSTNMPKAGKAASKPNSDIVGMPGRPRVSPEEVAEPPQFWIEDNEDPHLKALIARDLEKGMGVAKKYADKLIGDAFWPIGLCVAWVLGGDPSEAAQLYARHRLGMGVIHVDDWVRARTSLLRALTEGKIEALGVRPDDDPRVSIPAQEWIDLRIQQRGPYDEVGRADGSIAYRDVRIAAALMKMEWPAATPATNRARDQQENERACQKALMERMRANPNDPVPKKKLRLEFPEVSGRAFHQLFRQAVRETQCLAWSSAGRRSPKRDAN